MDTHTEQHGAILFYDGACGFCGASIRFVLAHERAKTLRFAALQDPIGMELLGRHPQLESVDSMVWYEPATASRPETLLVKSDAVHRIARYLGGGWRLFNVLSAIPRGVRDRAYDLIARNRHRILGTSGACVVPTPEACERFIGDSGDPL